MTAKERLEKNMLELGIEPKRSLGQNFLVSDHVIQKIVGAVREFHPKKLIEVGPGLGALTEELTEFHPQLLELDSKLVRHWQSKNFSVIEGDALQMDWSPLLKRTPEQSPCVLVSNLPYQIASSLVIERSLDENSLDGMILMFQKEVAQRIKAQQGKDDYGMLSVFAQTFWNIDLLLEASPRDFYPAPRIASRVLVFRKKAVEISHRRYYLRFIKAAFLHPRRLLSSNLQEGSLADKESVTAWLSQKGFNPMARPGELKLNDFLELFHSGVLRG